LATGRVKWFNEKKGFGFIEGDRGDVFFHLSSLDGVRFETLHEGQAVEYSEGVGPKGPRAEAVRPV